MHYSKRLRKALLFVLAIVITLINIAPLVWTFLTGFKTRLEIFTIPPVWVPKSFNLANYESLLDRRIPNLENSIMVTLGSTAGVLLIAIPAAFALVTFTFKRREAIELWILSTRMMPPIAAAIPLYLAIKEIGLYDTRYGLILVYIGFNLPFAIWMSITFMRQIPKEVIEAALVDGASWPQVLVRIAVPLSAGGLSTVAIFTALFCWNELLLAIFLTSSNSKTFTVVLTEFVGQTNIVWELMAAGAVIQIVPIVILTFLTQRYIVTGLTMGAVKG
jgi:ABC-type glycerol-3-phosphate transport system permease component